MRAAPIGGAVSIASLAAIFNISAMKIPTMKAAHFYRCCAGARLPPQPAATRPGTAAISRRLCEYIGRHK